MLRRTFFSAALLAGLAVAIGPGKQASADDAADFYKGQTLHFIVGYSPGGGFDRYARMLAPHLEKATGATVVVENQPGGGGLTALNRLVNADADGLSFMLINGVPATLSQIVEAPAAQYDLTKLAWIGRVVAEPWVVLVSSKSPYKSLDDLMAAAKEGKTITFAGIGRTDGPTDAASIFCEAMQISCKMVVGYKGSSEAALAAIRGEVVGLAVSDRGAADYSQENGMIPIAVLDHRRSKLVPDVPTIFELRDLTDEQKFWIDYRADIASIGRAVVAAPGTPDDRLAFLRDAFQKVLTDPEVIAEGASSNHPIDYLSGQEEEKLVDNVLGSVSTERLSAVRNVLLNKYF